MAFLADASAKGGGVDPIPAAKKSRFFSKYNKKCSNVLRQKNMHKYFVKFLQGYQLKTFLEILKFFL